jgi:cell division septation protein DedD
MRGVFEDEDPEPAKSWRDKELTLGSWTLLALFFGLVVLCGICFSLGYSLGHRDVEPTASSVPPTTPPGDQEPLQGNDSIPKPSAEQQTPVTPQQPGGTGQAAMATPNSVSSPVSGPVPGPASGATPAVPSQNRAPAAYTPAPAVHPFSTPGQPAVRPALGAANGSPQPAPSASTSSVRPAIASAGQFMVQIAAVSTPEDAEVLMDALRKRGYAVTVRRDLTDNLIHVSIGPFATRGLANQWRQKLLNDGYNAMVQP